MPRHEQGYWIANRRTGGWAPSPQRLGKDLVVDGRLAVVEQSRVHFAVLWHFNVHVRPENSNPYLRLFEICF